MFDFSKKTDAEKYFSSIMEDLQKSKIRAVFSFDPMSWQHYRGYRTYITWSELYVLFDNEFCLVIDYRFIDALKIQYRKLTADEKKKYSDLLEKDFFNTVNDIHDWREKRVYRTETCNLEYGVIKDISLRPLTMEYSKWINGNIGFASPNEETFDEITFTMSNGKRIVIRADEAEADGDVLFWSPDTVETITEIP